MKFKETLKDELAYKNLQSKELSARTGISLHTINHYLAQNGNAPSAENAYKIAKALGVSVEYLLTGNNPNIPDDINPKVKQLIPELNHLNDNDLTLIKMIITHLQKE